MIVADGCSPPRDASAAAATRIALISRGGRDGWIRLIEEAHAASGQRPALFRFAALLDIVEGPPAR